MPVTKTILIIRSNLSRRIPNIFTCWGSSLFIEFVENQNTLTLNTDLLKQAAQFNDANLLASLTYTTKAQQPFEIGYNYTNGGNILEETIDGNNQLTINEKVW
ncbi:hypothetical protein [uncultured Rummeliibacillus sp.]|uniref:hypothetical protein n=1 Tax=uncultured Rummeliibacillus sp. TaxID=762292 RepID=UPI0026193468|nr:hypothetical protein [uncultured Rummeliibacillus sp.]